jgi:hypothetical protein
MTPNRVVAVAASLVTLALAALPVLADMDWTSTAGILAGITAVLGIVLKWLTGWQQHEARQPARALGLRAIADAFTDDDDKLPGDPEHPDAVDITPADPSAIPADKGDPGPKAVKA